MKKVIVPIFVPHMGCSHACVFCNQYKITGQWQPPSAATLAERLKHGRRPAILFQDWLFMAEALPL